MQSNQCKIVRRFGYREMLKRTESKLCKVSSFVKWEINMFWFCKDKNFLFLICVSYF